MLKLANRGSSQRAKGLRGKRVFQACILLVLFIWLLYKVKHSYEYEGKKEEDRKAMKETSTSSEDMMTLRKKKTVNLGRKNLDGQEINGGNDGGVEKEETIMKQETEEDEDQETEQLVGEDAIDEDDREKENYIDQFGEEGEKNDDASGSVED